MSSSLQLVPKPPSRQGARVDLRELCAKAIQFHQSGQLAQAEQIYRQILDLDPRHADSLHLLGVLAHQVGRNDVSVELIRKAIAIDKRPAAYHSNLGTALQALGNFDEAAACYESALKLKPDLAEAQMNLGVVLEAQGNLDSAEKHFRRALALRPSLAEAHVNLGNILQTQGKQAEAVARYERALQIKPDMAEVHGNLGNAHQARGNLEEAITSYKRALSLKPTIPELHTNLANALLAQGNLHDAEISYARALELRPQYAEAWYNLGNLRQAENKLGDPGKLTEAALCYERAIALKPQLPEAHYNLGNTLHALDQLESAAASFERALALRPTYAEAHYNLGCVLEELGRLDEALRAMAGALEVKPDYPQARFGQALAQLRAGDFTIGWRNYNSRWRSPDHNTPWRDYPQPLWRGEKLASGRLLLWGEQGIGDEIQFAGLIPDALRTGNSIVLDCDARLQTLFARSFPEVEVVSGCGPAESSSFEIDAQLSAGSLPGVFRNSEAAFAVTTSPYLKADSQERERFRDRYNDGRRLIGLAWHTRNQSTGRKRCIDLSAFAPLFALTGMRWISLQYGDFDSLEAQAAQANAPLLIDRTVDQFVDVDRFAAQVAAMDRIVTIDNSTAHLAGALGLPVALLLPFSADWRWQDRRVDSPWYPTVRLIRQPKAGDWASVIETVRVALAADID
ncbi:MAG: tetratricopeptide repeat protein [Terracidiphilus sp.]|jgi:tetratricopeptide (TPR) repeat protein